MIVGMDRLAQTIEKMPSKYLRKCNRSKDQLKALQTWSQTYSSQQVALNFELLDNQMSVEYAKASYQYKNDLYWEFGEEIGAIIRILNKN